jgi:hypothetical protein
LPTALQNSGASAMKYYRCYLLDAQFHIAITKVIKCADDDDAREQCRDAFALSDGYRGVELWDSERRIYVFPRDELESVGENASRHRTSAAAANIADAHGPLISDERQRKLH